jgi:hypothetical protein
MRPELTVAVGMTLPLFSLPRRQVVVGDVQVSAIQPVATTQAILPIRPGRDV